MPWNVVDKLEQICINLNKKKIETILLKDLETVIIKNLGVTRETTIERYIKILIKLKWIKKNGKNIKIIYYKNKGELF